MFRRLGAAFSAACLGLAAFAPAHAQSQLPQMQGPNGLLDVPPAVSVPFQPDAAGSAGLSASTVSARIALPGAGPTVLVQNLGTNTVYVVLGGSGVTATTTGTPIQPGCTASLYTGASATAATYLAAVTASGAGSLTITTGKGSASAVCAGAGGSVTITGSPTVSPQAVYNASPPAPAAGAYAPLQGDSQADLKTYTASLGAGEDLANNVQGVLPKPVISATYSRSLDTSFGTLVTHNSKATAAQWFGAYVTSVNAAVRYLQLYNSTGSTSGTPVISIPIPAGSSTVPGVLEVDDRLLGQNGLNFSIGLTWAISTTQGTYTAAAASDHTVTLPYQ